MKLTLKLPLAFAGALMAMFVGALYGIHALNQALASHATTVNIAYENRVAVRDLAVQFKTQVQEWKNVLIRGKNPAALDKHWRAFSDAAREVDQRAARLLATLPASPSRDRVQGFATAHAAMGARYQQGLADFKAAGFDPHAGDVAVAGVDREPVALLGAAADLIGATASAESARAAEAGRRATAVSVGLMFVVCATCIAGSVLFSRTITRRIASAIAFARGVARGDLAMPIDVAGSDELTELMHMLRDMQAGLGEVVSAVRGNAESVAAASAQIAQGNLDLSQRTEEQASALEQTSATMDQLGSTVRLTANNARQAAGLVHAASGVAARGGAEVVKVVDTMQAIDDGSRKVTEIIGVIDAIAFQTNILALNAAVEAARAGEQGRGFAVVAGEVRTLAQRSAEAARQIKALIGGSVEQVDRGTALVHGAGRTMADIVAAVERVSTIVVEISGATDEQSLGVGQVGQAVAQMDQVTQRNAALVEEGAAAAENLRVQAQQLLRAVSVFKLANGPAVPAFGH